MVSLDLESIPELALEIILNKLSRKDARNCRLVNHHLKRRTDDLYTNWHLRKNKYMPDEFALALLNLKLKKVKNRQISQLFPTQPNGTIFKYPNLIQSIALGSDDDEYFDVTEAGLENLDNILKSCTNLRTLKLRLPLYFEANFYPPTYKFPNLCKLEIKTSSTSYINYGNVKGILQQLLLHSQMPKVASLSLKITHSVDKEIMTGMTQALFTFIERNSQVLKKVVFNGTGGGAFYTISPINYDYSKCSSLEKLHFEGGGTLSQNETWTGLIQRQRALKSLAIKSCASLSFLATKIFPNFSSTLVSLSLDWLKVDMGILQEHPDNEQIYDLDCEVFRVFPNLEILRLDVSRAHEFASPKIKNLNLLPSQLRTLIGNLAVDADDLLQFCSSRPRLKEIMFGSARQITPNGLTSHTLFQMMITTRLTSIEFVYETVRRRSEDREYIMEILKLLGKNNAQIFKTNGFILWREDRNSQWKIKYNRPEVYFDCDFVI